MLSELIEALQIFLKYGNPCWPTSCEHDTLMVLIDPEIVSDEDKEKLEKLGFFADEIENCFMSFKYGSA